MTREQRWLRAELKVVVDGIAMAEHWDKLRALGQLLGDRESGKSKRHFRARAETLRRILAIVERAQNGEAS